MKFRVAQLLCSLVFTSLFVMPSEAAATAVSPRSGVNVLLYENGRKITDNSVVSMVASFDTSKYSLCEDGCCNLDTQYLYLQRRKPEPILFTKTHVRNILSPIEWQDQYYLSINGCEDFVTKTDEEYWEAINSWARQSKELHKGKSEDELTELLKEHMVSKGFISYGRPAGYCDNRYTNYNAYFHDKAYDAYMDSFINNPEYTVSIDIPYPESSPADLYPLKCSDPRYQGSEGCYRPYLSPRTGIISGWRERRTIQPDYALDQRNWFKVDIAKGTAELVTVEMRKEVQKMIDAELGFDEVKDRMCREDFLPDPPPAAPPDKPETDDLHAATIAQSPDTRQPYAVFLAGMLFAVLFGGSLLLAHRGRNHAKSERLP